MTLNFPKFVQKAEEFIGEVAFELGDPNDKIKAARILRAVLHAFRDWVTPAESLQMIAQLPMFIKAMYVDGWKIRDGSEYNRHMGDFIEAVREADDVRNNGDFVTDFEAKEAINAVFRVLKNHVSEGEVRDIIAVLPSEMKSAFAMA